MNVSHFTGNKMNNVNNVNNVHISKLQSQS